MNPWAGVILGALAVFSWKYLGYLLPEKLLESKFLSRAASYLTIALLAGLVGVQSFVENKNIVFDARVPAILLAAILLKFKVPFIVVVISSAATAALIRLAF
jgi:branched-subunit amino acid transport protein